MNGRWVISMPYPFTTISQVYTLKGYTPIQVLPLLNAPTNSFVVCSCIYTFCLEIAIRPAAHCGLRIEVHLNRNTYYAWAHNKRIGVRIEERKYLHWCTPFWCVNVCIGICSIFHQAPTIACTTIHVAISCTWLYRNDDSMLSWEKEANHMSEQTLISDTTLSWKQLGINLYVLEVAAERTFGK